MEVLQQYQFIANLMTPRSILLLPGECASPSTGVTVAPEAVTHYKEVKDKKYRYVIYHIKDERVIEVETTGARDATYSDFLTKLQEYKNECRYCVFDFPTNIPVEGGLALICWCPDGATFTERTSYTKNLAFFKSSLTDIKHVLHVQSHVEGSEVED